MFADLISAGDPRWGNALERLRYDVYHLPDYSRFAARHEGGVPSAFYAESSGRVMLIPLLLRDVPVELGAPPGWKDAASAYGYPGPLTSHPNDEGWLEECRVTLEQLARRHDVVAAFLRLHPLRGVPAERLSTYGDVVTHGPVVYLDLTKGADELCSETRPNHRRDIRRLRRAGFTAIMDDWDAYLAFPSLYRATMDRVSADPFYYFSDQYFADLALMLNGHLHICAVVSPDGHLAAAGLFTETDGFIQYHLGGTALAHLRDAPSKLIFETVAQWGKSAGATAMNLGGGTGSRCDSLFQFKAGFSPSRALFHTLRIVFDDHRYSELARLWAARYGGEETAGGYFPVYRQPRRETRGVTTACTTRHSNA